jgi:hypothetical protein
MGRAFSTRSTFEGIEIEDIEEQQDLRGFIFAKRVALPRKRNKCGASEDIHIDASSYQCNKHHLQSLIRTSTTVHAPPLVERQGSSLSMSICISKKEPRKNNRQKEQRQTTSTITAMGSRITDARVSQHLTSVSLSTFDG